MDQITSPQSRLRRLLDQFAELKKEKKGINVKTDDELFFAYQNEKPCDAGLFFCIL